MANTTKKYEIQQKLANGDTLTLLPKTDAAIVEYAPSGNYNLSGATNVKEALDIVNSLNWVTGIKQGSDTAGTETGTVTITPAKIGAATSAQGTKADNAMPKSGGTFTGAITLSGAPTANLHAATKKYVDDLVGAVKQFTYEVVDTLPTASASTMNKIYLVNHSHGTGDTKDEYITIQSGSAYSWEKIGNTDIDLTAYAKTEDVASTYQTKTDSNLNGAIGTTNVVSAINTVHGFASTNASDITKITNGTTKVKSAETADSATSATSATKLATARTIALKGDATGSTTFDGSANKDITVTLANSGVTAGTYSAVTVNAKGLVTAGAQIIEVGATGVTTPSANLAIGGIFFKEIS